MNSLLFILIMSILGSKFKGMLESEGQILNGFDLEQRDFNYHVSIFYKGNHKCAGGILDNNHVITAAHCVKNYKKDLLLIVAGVKYLHDDTRQSRAVESIIIDTMMSLEERRLNDIVLLKNPFVLGENIGVITLPTVPISSSNNLMKCSITGLEDDRGKQQHEVKLSWTKLTIIPTEMAECLSRRNLEASWLYTTNDDVGKVTNGDSGSILVCDGVAAGILYGVVLLPNRLPGKVFVFSRIYNCLEFIKRHQSIVNP